MSEPNFAGMAMNNAINEAKKSLWTAKNALKQFLEDWPDHDGKLNLELALYSLATLGENLRAIQRYKEELDR